MNLLGRITVNPAQGGGRTCLRGMRIRVIDGLTLLPASLKADEVLQGSPELDRDDLQACLVFAAEPLGGEA